MKGKKILLPITLAALTLVGCGKKNPEVKGRHTYNTYTAISPSNWNELTYQDENDTQIMSYLAGSFFTYDFVRDSQGEIVDGQFKTCFDGATALEDVTSTYAGDEKYAIPEGKTSSYAYKITLRNDLKWDDGTEIHAKDFVYTMKQLLDPAFQNYRADTMYQGSTVIHNAFNYVKQGKTIMHDNYDFEFISDESDLVTSGTQFTDSEGNPLYIGINVKLSYIGNSLAAYRAYLDQTSYGILASNVITEDGAFKGYAPLNATTFAALKDMLNNSAMWGEDESYFPCYLFAYKPVAEISFDKVGIFTGEGENSNELFVILDQPLDLLEGSELGYKAAYNFASLPLVKESLYESCKKAPATEGGLWTSNYNSSLETTASWGPYKLTQFQAAKSYVLEKNPYWYGWNMDEYAGQYQTDRIVCDTIESAQTAWLAFQKGDLASIGISQAIGNTEYKNSSRAFFTADDYVGAMQLQSNVEALKANQETASTNAGKGINKTILGNVKFRKAISVGFNREEYLQATSVASKPGFGLFNSMHYYDVAHGKTYRGEDVAKKVICDVYGVEYTEANLDEKYESVTGLNLPLAKQLFTEAYNEEIASTVDGHLKETDVIEFDVDTSVINESTTLSCSEMQKQFDKMTQGTPFEGKITLKLSDHGDEWADDFRAGACEICTGGWSGAAWDPGYFLAAYVDAANMYSAAWDTENEELTLTLTPCDDGDPDNITNVTHTIMDWYDLLNDEWAEGEVSNGFRLQLIAELEKCVLVHYYTVPLYNYFSSQLVTYKIEYATRNYNTFMGYGGVRYMSYNYDDYEWYNVKSNQNYLR